MVATWSPADFVYKNYIIYLGFNFLCEYIYPSYGLGQPLIL